MQAVSLEQHLSSTGAPKRILSLDGGGIRGFLSLQYLAKIENLLRERYRSNDLLLCDYFDLIGGTSTGAIIAAGLAIGMSTADLISLYEDLGPKVFKASTLRIPFFAPKFPAGPLKDFLVTHFGSTTQLGGAEIKTGLMITCKRLDTGSVWPLHNHPSAKYSKQDLALNLTDVIRASTAAPTYFQPEEIEIFSRGNASTRGLFVDGGVTPFNDPALQLLMLSALEGHGFRWPQGVDKLLLVSIGTGSAGSSRSTQALLRMGATGQALRALKSLMDDCARTNRALLQWMTQCLTPWRIDSAMGEMREDSQKGPKLATYVRYDVLLEQNWIKDNLPELKLDMDTIDRLAEMDQPENLLQLGAVGRSAASKQVLPEHFPSKFDI